MREFIEWWDDHWCHIAAIAMTVIIVATIGAAVENEQNRIDSGIIVDKRMNAGGTYYSSDKNGGHMRSYPPSYSFTIRGDRDGEVVEYTFEVTAEEYGAYKIGEVYHR